MEAASKERIFGLDLMRATAIMFVILAHCLWLFPEAGGPIVSLLNLMGVMGVEIFFVLSGFLIGRILFRIFTKTTNTKAEFKYFVIRRWFRTLPNYYLILLVNIGILIYFGREFPPTLPLYFFFLQNITFGMDIFFTESWSLPVEEIAYILGPFLLYASLFFDNPDKRSKRFLVITSVILLIFFCTKLIYHYKTETNSPEIWNINLKAVVLYRIDSIYYGVLAAYLSFKYAGTWKRRILEFTLMGLGLFIGLQGAISFLNISYEGNAFFWNVLYLPLNSFCLALFLPFLSQWKIEKNLFGSVITFISVISYSMYLLHYSVILQLMRYFFPIEDLSFSEKLFYSIIYIIITICVSYLFFKFYEKPMMNIRDSPFVKNKFFKSI